MNIVMKIAMNQVRLHALKHSLLKKGSAAYLSDDYLAELPGLSP